MRAPRHRSDARDPGDRRAAAVLGQRALLSHHGRTARRRRPDRTRRHRSRLLQLPHAHRSPPRLLQDRSLLRHRQQSEGQRAGRHRIDRAARATPRRTGHRRRHRVLRGPRNGALPGDRSRAGLPPRGAATGLRAHPQKQRRGDHEMKRKKILLVDDSNTILMMEKFILRNDPYELVSASNGEEAVRKAAEVLPDLILLDVIMPKMGGFEACRLIRQNELTRSIPVIMVTTRGEAVNVEAGWANGCTDYVTKPINAVELLAKVRSFLEMDAPVLADVQQ